MGAEGLQSQPFFPQQYIYSAEINDPNFTKLNLWFYYFWQESWRAGNGFSQHFGWQMLVSRPEGWQLIQNQYIVKIFTKMCHISDPD